MQLISLMFLVPGGNWFLNPIGLWGLAIIPPIILLYILKLKRQPQVVSSTMLWSTVLREMQANTPFQKLRNNLLLWLQLLMVLLIAIALARPIFRGQLKLGKRIVVILDTSASMKTKDIDGKTRFEKAKEGAQEMIKNMAEGDTMMLLEGTRSHGTQTVFTAKKRQLYQALEKMYPRDTSTELSESLILAVSSLKGQKESDSKNGEIYILSDAANLHLDRINNINVPVILTQFGKIGDNLGIIAMDVRRVTGTKDEYEIFVNIKNYFADSKKFYVSLKAGESRSTIDAREMELSPQESKSTIFRAQLTPGEIVIEIDEEDAFPIDNKAFYYVVEENNSPVLIVTDGQNSFLEKVLKVDPLADVMVVRHEDYTEDLLKDQELVIFDRFLPPSIPSVKTVFISPPATPEDSEFPFRIKDDLVGTEITEWNAVHPLMRYVELGDVQIFQTKDVEFPVGHKALAKVATGPIISLVPYKNVEHVLVSFDIRASNWVLRASFIIFFSNVLQQARIQLRQLAGDTTAGNAVSIRVQNPEDEIFVETPQGKKLTILNSGETTYFSDTDEVGFYSVQVGEQQSKFAVNLLNEEESAIQPENNITLGSKKIEVQLSVNKVNREVWWWFALAVLSFALLEWFIFHKRIV